MDMEIISVYTDDDGVEDGVLARLEKDGKPFSELITLATTTLLVSEGYMEDDELDVPNVMDLVRQGEKIIHHYGVDRPFVAGSVEMPSGKRKKLFIAMNMSGKYTIMLPSDY